MGLFNLFGRFGLVRGKTGVRRTPRKRVTLTLETLEDRVVPASVIQSASFASAVTDWSASLGTFNRFDPTLGTLTGVVVTESANMNLTGSGNKVTSISD